MVRKTISRVGILSALAIAVFAGGCTVKGNVHRKYDENGNLIDETQHQKWELLPGFKLNPGQILPPLPGITVDFPGAPNVRPVRLPDGRPGIILPGDPNTVHPVKERGPARRAGAASAADYDIEVNFNEGDGSAQAILQLPEGARAPDLLQDGDDWKAVSYSRVGDTEQVFAKDPAALAGFLYAHGFTDFGEFGHTTDLKVIGEGGHVLAILTVGEVTVGGTSTVLPLVVSENR